MSGRRGATRHASVRYCTRARAAAAARGTPAMAGSVAIRGGAAFACRNAQRSPLAGCGARRRREGHCRKACRGSASAADARQSGPAALDDPSGCGPAARIAARPMDLHRDRRPHRAEVWGPLPSVSREPAPARAGAHAPHPQPAIVATIGTTGVSSPDETPWTALLLTSSVRTKAKG